jgi:dihydroneopterin aldolase
MALISLEGMKFHANHGVYEAEKTLGATYVVDIVVNFNTEKAAKDDDVEKTMNYESIYQICRMEMETPRKLVETVVANIVKRMKFQFSEMQALRVRVSKLDPPLGGRVAMAWVQDDLDFKKDCPRCKKPFINYDADDCWKRFPNLHPATKETLERQFDKKCICDKCLKFYVGEVTENDLRKP